MLMGMSDGDERGGSVRPQAEPERGLRASRAEVSPNVMKKMCIIFYIVSKYHILNSIKVVQYTLYKELSYKIRAISK